jgi:hypothetical protein
MGLPVRCTIQKVDLQAGIVYVNLSHIHPDKLYPVKIPAGWVGSNGEISAGYPAIGTNIFCTLSQGGEWVFVNYNQQNLSKYYTPNGKKRVPVTNKLAPGRWATLVNNDVGLIVDPKEGIIEGDSIQFTQSDPVHNLWSIRFDHQLEFSEAHRHTIGPIKRDEKSSSTRGIDGSSLSGHSYISGLRPIGLDPSTNVSVAATATRNPGLTENRSIYYEFLNSFGYTNDLEEERIYSGENPSTTKPYQRKNNITDTLNLSLDQPNYLLEVIIGTIVDIYGNILDINRNVLPNGLIDSLSFRNTKDNKNEVFKKLIEQLRKSIAYHFELNVRKDNFNLPDYNNIQDYSRNRSRFQLDIDKEGQFKLNVPCSSEIGNIPLLVRHENFSNLKGAENEGTGPEADRGRFIRNATSKKDVFLEPYGQGCVTLKSNEDTLKSFIAPTDRHNTDNVIKLGTAFHDISKILVAHQVSSMYSGTGGYVNSLLNYIAPVGDIISNEVVVAGEGANAGGRSGTLSLDGSLSLSIGANTVDRQSLWLDCAGGIVSAIGRDKYNRSVSASLDGDLYLEIGGPTVNNDSRFKTEIYNNEARDGVVDIRIWNSGSFHTIRIDNKGIKIHTPQRIDIVSEGEMRFKSVRNNITFDAENITFYSSLNPPREVERTAGVKI